jgi:hypothetical protein
MEEKEFYMTEEIMAKVPLAESRLREMAENISVLVGKVEDLEADKKAYDSRINGMIKELEAEYREVAAAIRSGTEEKLVRCEVFLDVFHREAVYQDISTGEIVMTRPMTEKELQRPLFGAVPEKQDVGYREAPWNSAIPIRQNLDTDFVYCEDCWDCEYAVDQVERDLRRGAIYVDTELCFQEDKKVA